jgi:hypothetical protein
MTLLGSFRRDPASALQSPDTETLNPTKISALKAKIIAQPEMKIDTLGILNAMVMRFEAAKREISAAHGVLWKNDTWDLVAKKLRSKISSLIEYTEGETALQRNYRPAGEFNGGEDRSGVAVFNETGPLFE